jgi:pimeloyl-ACP methyl ester carboxylesterase
MPNPPVLLVHGLGSSFEHNWRATGWVDMFESEGRSVLSVHLPGHGPGVGSGPVHADRYGDGAPERILAAADAAATRVDAVGFSMGGQALLAAAARRPDAFRRIAVLGVGTQPDEEPTRATAAIAAGLETDEEPVEDVPRIIRRLVASAGNDRFAVAGFLRAARDPLRLADLQRITVPTLVVIGDRDFAAPADGLVAALPDSELVVLRGVDHFATPSDYHCIDAVLKFLQR